MNLPRRRAALRRDASDAPDGSIIGGPASELFPKSGAQACRPVDVPDPTSGARIAGPIDG